MNFISILLMLALSLQLFAEGIPNKTYDVHGTCYPMIYELPGDNTLQKLQSVLDEARDTFVEKRYSDALYLYNRVCFAMIPENKNIEEEAERMDQKMLHLFCDALQGRLACAYNMGMWKDKRHRMEQDILERIDDRIPKYIEEEDAYAIADQGFDEEDIAEFIRSMEDVGIVEKSTDVTVQPDGSIKFKMKQDSCTSCCDSCADGKECEGEKKNPKLIPKHRKSVKRCSEMCDIFFISVTTLIRTNPAATAVTAVLAYKMNQECKQCCKSKRFFENCILPLKQIVNTPVDPSHNDHYDDYLNNWDVNSGKWAERHYEQHQRYWNQRYGRNK